MSDLTDFLQMGGYAFYVWTSYGVVALVLIGTLADALWRRRRLVRELARRERREQGRRQARETR